MGVSGLLTAGVSVLGPVLREDLMLSRVELSLFALVVFVTASITSLPWGWLSDRLSVLRGIALTCGFAILGLLGVIASSSLPGLLVAAVAGGCSLALSTTVSSKAVGQFVAPQRRGRVLSTKQMGIQGAQIIAGFVFPAIAAVFGWRLGLTAGVLLAAVSLLLILATRRRAFTPMEGLAERQDVAKYPSEATWKTALLGVVMVYAFVTAICFQSNLFGLPLAGYEELGFDIATASQVVVVIGFVGFLARLAWSRFADRPLNIRLIMIVMGVGLFLGQSFLVAVHISGVAWFFWLGAAGIGAFYALVPVVLSGVALQYFPPSQIGMVSGIISLSIFGGFALGPVIYGAIVDSGGYLSSAWALLAVVIISLLAALLLPTRKARMKQGALEKTSNLVRKEV
ncbi:arabinose transporter permease [Enteractinococcus helveticum]|uniref:Arabinose transporter permease n=2 Tax=Enteractinococcus helveticum TaxID=1837282 RepID=A0A1B7LUI3_9MICC|nr:arabinose transporter permease [Enteractinococcus helveticum]